MNSFETRHADYAFFLAQSDEPERCREVFLETLRVTPHWEVPWRCLDFGCGSGEFLESLLVAWSPTQKGVTIHLVDVDAAALTEARVRLERFASPPVHTSNHLPERETFHLILSNHALYYVEDAPATLTQMAGLLHEDGMAIVTMGGRQNQICRLWLRAFEAANRPLPFYLAEDIQGILEGAPVKLEARPVHSTVRFPDSPENRLRIARFAFGARLPGFGPERITELFDEWKEGSEIVMRNRDLCFKFGKA